MQKIWIDKELDIEQELLQKHYDQIMNYARDNKLNVVNEWLKGNLDECKKSLKLGSAIMNTFERGLGKDDDSIFALGSLLGTIQCLERLYQDSKETVYAIELFDSAIYSVKHLKEIVATLEMYGVMSHTELCQKLEIEKSTLSEAMKKVQDTGLITSSKMGKYKLYVLSDLGKKYGKYIRRKKSEAEDITQNIVNLLMHSEVTNDVLLFIEQLIKTNGANMYDNLRGKHLTVGYVEQGKKKKVKYKVDAVWKDVAANELAIEGNLVSKSNVGKPKDVLLNCLQEVS